MPDDILNLTFKDLTLHPNNYLNLSFPPFFHKDKHDNKGIENWG